MANQFTAKLRFEAFAWKARDPETGLFARVVERFDDTEWSVYGEGKAGLHQEGGKVSNPKNARAACRRAIARVAKELKARKKK